MTTIDDPTNPVQTAPAPTPSTLWTRIDSPIGPLLVTRDAAAPRGISAVYLPHGRHRTEPDDAWVRDEDAFGDIRSQFAEYFAGQRTIFKLPLAPRGTAFQLRVWQGLRDIPYGTTTSYGALAAQLGAPTASRAVGLANGQNPISIVVPCHRVIGANGALTGYAGGLDAKRWLLGHEAQRSGLFAS